MTLDEAKEAALVLDTMLSALLGSLQGDVGEAGASFRYGVSDLRVAALDRIQAGALGAPLLRCFLLAIAAGATVLSLDRVRVAILAEVPGSTAAAAVATAGLRFALGSQARILAATTFPSSDAVLAALSKATDAFESAEEYAADNRDPAAYQALIGLHATVVRDLTTRACVLPKLVTYVVPSGMTAHALASRLYGDAGRANELQAENGVAHPAFMPSTGTCLSE